MTAARVRAGRGMSVHVKYVLFALLALMVLFVLYQRDSQLLNANSFLRQRYTKAPWLLLAHGVCGALALLLAPFQFSTRLRQRYLWVHRLIGRLYVVGVAIAAPLAIPIAIILGPPVLVMAASIQASGWILTTATGLYCVRTGRIQSHREWMMRSYPFALVFLVVRVLNAIPAIARMGELGRVSVVWSVIAVACFLPSFLIAWRGVFTRTTRPAKAEVVAAAAVVAAAVI